MFNIQRLTVWFSVRLRQVDVDAITQLSRVEGNVYIT